MQAIDNPVPMTDIHDIKPLEILTVDWSLLVYILGAVLILAIIGAAIYYWKKSQNRKRIPVEVPVLPHEAALRLLDALADVENMDAKAFYFSLSNILRAYIQARYGINALEMTTEELLPKIDILDINKEIHLELKALLRSTDPVKFAGVPAAVIKMRQDLAFVRNFVKQTEEKLAVG
ncbi:MAG: DUF4381 family protein [Deltaproteobacteria bacterium]|nr:DUF4381 family protein [Deltaproteobacteria bacterium]